MSLSLRASRKSGLGGPRPRGSGPRESPESDERDPTRPVDRFAANVALAGGTTRPRPAGRGGPRSPDRDQTSRRPGTPDSLRRRDPQQPAVGRWLRGQGVAWRVKLPWVG